MYKKLFGLLGRSLSHSFSQKYFEEKFLREGLTDCSYQNFEIADISQIGKVFGIAGLQGFNVTIPYKEAIIPFLDLVDDVALEVGAVNTVKRVDAGDNGSIWKGYNTDVIGFEKSLFNLLTPLQPAQSALPMQSTLRTQSTPSQAVKALVFGTGGAARAVQYVLKKNNIPFLTAGRGGKGDLDYRELKTLQQYKLLINTTSVGMYPNINDVLPLPYESISKETIACDLIYNPAQSSFLQRAYAQGAVTKNGLDMLQFQADAAWKIWSASL